MPNAGKHPRTKNGLKDGNRDAAQIFSWWDNWPDSNVGLVTGAASGTVVIDIDPRNGGDKSLAVLEQEHGKLPATVESLTSGGGRHFIFAHPGGVVKNRSNVRPGIDVRGDGGYIVAPPSKHASGEQYRWRDGATPADLALLPLPAWLHELITVAATPQPTTSSATSSPSSTDAPTRDDRCARCLQSLLRIKTLDGKDGSKRLFAAACRCVEHDLSDSEAVACIRSYAAVKPFPQHYDDIAILARVRDAEKRAERGEHQD